MLAKLLVHLRRQWIGVIALFVALGGTALATHPGGQNTISSADIINGEVKVADVGQGAVATDEIANNQVKAADIGDGEVRNTDIANGQVLRADIGDGEVRSADVANDNLTGGDIAGNSLKGADIDEGTLDIGDSARAYARVFRISCTGTPGTCTPDQSKGISSVTRDSTGVYCVTAPGINSSETPAVVSVDWNGTSSPEGTASVFMAELQGCGPNGEGFVVFTYHGQNVDVVDSGGTPRTVAGRSNFSDEVSFTIVIP